MPPRFRNGPRHQPAMAAIVLALALAAAGPALSQASRDDTAPATDTTQPGPTEQIAPASPEDRAGRADKRPTDADRMGDDATGDDQTDDAIRPSQQLPQPKSSDYGASSYNAPSDAELARFNATHQPSPQTDDTDNAGDTTESDAGYTESTNGATGAAGAHPVDRQNMNSEPPTSTYETMDDTSTAN